ncbi:AAA family ATPase [Desulfothermobacter acidiphilus]|uniref:AAA family ATPase n=1 Tax=Desulfothermobacter acidiphilus TaxID=1938353 RepID=UPI003F8B6686
MPYKPYKEVALGLASALIIFLAANGYDLLPLLFLGGALGLLFYFLHSRGAVRSLVVKGGKDDDTITFAEIGGQRAAVEELKEALDFIRHYPQARRLGVRPLKGILLTGPPGTGKTLLAKAAAGYTDSVFLAASGSEFVEMYAGVGAQRIRNLFQMARERAQQNGKNRAIIFIDEIDVLGGKRGKVNSHLEYDQTLNQLLVEMDGMKGDEKVNILVIAATNRADLLDPALLRPGRFDRQVRVDLPDKEGRLEILQLHTRNKPLAPEVDLEAVAKETLGFSGAHLESLANEAAILALREGANCISQRHFMEAIERVMLGARLERRPGKEEIWRVAVHETGHAMVSEWIRPGSVTTLTVTPRGGALGYFRQQYDEDSYLYTQEQLEGRLAVLLAGAIAEEVVLGTRSTGAANDFEQATRIAETMVRSGMSRLGVAGSAEVPEELHHELLKEIFSRQEERVKNYLEGNRSRLISIAERLLAEERLTGEVFRELFAQERVPSTCQQEKRGGKANK